MISFKAYDPLKKMMYDIAFPSWNGNIIVWKNNEPQTEEIVLPPLAESLPILLPSTGVTDINSALSFAGDLIKLTSGMHYWIYEIKALGGQFGNNLFAMTIEDNFSEDEELDIYTFKKRVFENTNKRNSLSVILNGEIIGNIFTGINGQQK